MSTYIIYKTTNLLNNKIYVGKHQQETFEFDGYLGTGKIIKLTIKKYGVEHFIREILEFCTSANINEKEIYWIDKLSATNPEVGYNLTSGGEGGCVWSGNHPAKGKTGELSPWFGRKHSEETKKLISLKNKGFKRKPFSLETREKMSKSFKGRIISDSQKLKLSLAMSGKNHPNWGKKHKKETIDKMKMAQIGYKSPSNKYIFVLSNGENYWEFFSKNERCNINGKFRVKNTNIIIFKNIKIERILKNEKKD